MRAEEIYRRILQLRKELGDLIRDGEDLTRPEVIAKARDLDDLVVAYQRLVGSVPGLHSMVEQETDNGLNRLP